MRDIADPAEPLPLVLRAVSAKKKKMLGCAERSELAASTVDLASGRPKWFVVDSKPQVTRYEHGVELDLHSLAAELECVSGTEQRGFGATLEVRAVTEGSNQVASGRDVLRLHEEVHIRKGAKRRIAISPHPYCRPLQDECFDAPAPKAFYDFDQDERIRERGTPRVFLDSCASPSHVCRKLGGEVVVEVEKHQRFDAPSSNLCEEKRPIDRRRDQLRNALPRIIPQGRPAKGDNELGFALHQVFSRFAPAVGSETFASDSLYSTVRHKSRAGIRDSHGWN
jgi:hypothetical protein